jgi:hypothetical protein
LNFFCAGKKKLLKIAQKLLNSAQKVLKIAQNSSKLLKTKKTPQNCSKLLKTASRASDGIACYGFSFMLALCIAGSKSLSQISICHLITWLNRLG